MWLINRLPTAILIDMDDTILADSVDIEACWRTTCKSYADRVGNIDPETFYMAIRSHSSWYWSDAARHRKGRLDLVAARREIIRAVLQQLGNDDVQLISEIASAYSARRDAVLKPFPGAIETLGRLREYGVRLALITNGASVAQRRKIERYRLDRYFDCMLIEEEFGAGKP